MEHPHAEARHSNRCEAGIAVVGLTGGLGCGKSTVASTLERCGATWVSADRLGREAMQPGHPAFAEVVARFGPETLTDAGYIDRQALAKRIFVDSEARQVLEAIVHPWVHALSKQAFAAAAAQRAPYVVYESALLFETGRVRNMHAVVVVAATVEQQIARTMARENCSRASVVARIASQQPTREKQAAADYVIDNRGSPRHTEAQARELHSTLCARWKGTPPAFCPRYDPRVPI